MTLKKFFSLRSRKPDDNREAQAVFRLLQVAVLASLAGAGGTLVAINVFGATRETRLVIIVLTILLALSFALLQRRILWPARIMAPLSLFATITFLIVSGSGIHDIALIGYGGIIVVSSLTLGRRGAFIAAAFIIVAVFGVALAEINQILVTDASVLTTIDDPYLISIVVLSIALTQTALITRMNASLQDARDYAEKQIELNREVIELKDSLEARVQARTNELEQVNKLNQHRATLFESIALIARSVTSLENPSILLPNLVQQISHLLNYELVAIYVQEDDRDKSLRAAIFDQSLGNAATLISESALSTEVLAGVVLANGLSRMALNEGADRVYFSKPAVSNLNSEIALPLIAGARVMGVLDVFSKRSHAFDAEEVFTLTTLADIISNAVESSKQFQLSRDSLSESVSAYAESLGQEWRRFKRDENLAGFRYAEGISEPIQPSNTKSLIAKTTDATQFDTVRVEKGIRARMLVPVRLRGESLGNLEISMPEDYAWSEDDIDIVETVAERLALSMENARLFQTSASRAERERVVTEISSKISGSVRIESILHTAAQELSQALSGAEVLIRLQTGNPQAGPQ